MAQKRFLDASGLNQYTSALKNGTLVVGKAVDASNALYAATANAEGLVGVVPLANLPAGALDRLVQVENQAAMLALTTDSIQLGDTVQLLDTKVMYVVVDESKLGSMDAFVEYSAGRAAFAEEASTADVALSVAWANVNGKPEEFKPEAHTHGAADVSSLAGYTKAEGTPGDVAATDSLLVALGKIEKKADDAKSSAGEHVQDASTINMTGYVVAETYAAVEATDNALEAISKVERKALDASNTAVWDNVTGKPTEFVPEAHDAAKVTSIDGYSLDGVSGDVSEGDDLKTAIAKIEVKANNGADQPIESSTIDAIIAQTWVPEA